MKKEVRRRRIWLVLFTYLFHTINDRKRSQEEYSGQMVVCFLSHLLFHLQQLQRFNAQDRKAQQSLQTSFFLVGYKKTGTIRLHIYASHYVVFEPIKMSDCTLNSAKIIQPSVDGLC